MFNTNSFSELLVRDSYRYIIERKCLDSWNNYYYVLTSDSVIMVSSRLYSSNVQFVITKPEIICLLFYGISLKRNYPCMWGFPHQAEYNMLFNCCYKRLTCPCRHDACMAATHNTHARAGCYTQHTCPCRHDAWQEMWHAFQLRTCMILLLNLLPSNEIALGCSKHVIK